jgi:hypothetical protein
MSKCRLLAANSPLVGWCKPKHQLWLIVANTVAPTFGSHLPLDGRVAAVTKGDCCVNGCSFVGKSEMPFWEIIESMVVVGHTCAGGVAAATVPGSRATKIAQYNSVQPAIQKTSPAALN